MYGLKVTIDSEEALDVKDNEVIVGMGGAGIITSMIMVKYGENVAVEEASLNLGGYYSAEQKQVDWVKTPLSVESSVKIETIDNLYLNDLSIPISTRIDNIDELIDQAKLIDE